MRILGNVRAHQKSPIIFFCLWTIFAIPHLAYTHFCSRPFACLLYFVLYIGSFHKLFERTVFTRSMTGRTFCPPIFELLKPGAAYIDPQRHLSEPSTHYPSALPAQPLGGS